MVHDRIDFIGPVSPPGEDGSLTISDYFPKWVEAIPTPDKTATDNGSEFCNKLNDKLAEILGVKRRLTTPYHPQVGV